MSQGNPCLTWGACCAYFRVTFYWGEADPAQGGTVPPDLAEDVTGFYRCMKGTNQAHPRCAALLGEVGSAVRCSIYANRPSPCREFGVQWGADGPRINGDDLARCNRARAAWGLPPLDVSPMQPSTHETPPIGHAA